MESRKPTTLREAIVNCETKIMSLNSNPNRSVDENDQMNQLKNTLLQLKAKETATLHSSISPASMESKVRLCVS